MRFRRFMEDAEEVMKIIRQSPNHQKADAQGFRRPDFWDNYKDRWGVKGEFVERKFSLDYIMKLIDKNILHLSSVQEDGVQSKQKSQDYNQTIIGKPSRYEPYPLAVLDGTHSLVAAMKNKEPEIRILISQEALKYLGLE